MKKGLTELVFILDRSGSMRGLESDTIGGFNSMLDKQKRLFLLLLLTVWKIPAESISINDSRR